MRRRRRSRPRLITICRGPIIPLTCSFKFKFSALIPKAHDRAQLNLSLADLADLLSRALRTDAEGT